MTKVFFIADLHFGHKDVIAFDNRPFRVKTDDTVYILGDFIWAKEHEWIYFVEPLAGNKVLIRGNHDPKGEVFESLFEEVALSKQIQVRVRGEKQRVVMRHRLLPVFRGSDEGVVQLYGHTHDSLIARIEDEYIKMMNWLGFPLQAFNVSACRMDYEPKTLEEIMEKAGVIRSR